MLGANLQSLFVLCQSRPAQPLDLGLPIHFGRRLHDDLSLRLLYAAADVFVIPSFQDNMPNTGLLDILDDRITGALADPFDPASLAAAIRWELEPSK